MADEPRVERNLRQGALAGVEIDAVLEVYRSLDLDDQLRRLMHGLARSAGCDSAVVFGPGIDEPMLRRIAELGRALDWSHDRLLDRAALERTMDGRSIHRFDALPEPLAAARTAGASADGPWWLCSVRGDGPALVALVVLGRGPQGPDLDQAGRFLEVARGAVANGVRVREMRSLVYLDDHAECYNRRYFDDYLAEELARAQRFGAPFSLIFLDMDNLKEVNNLHGHAMGSRTLLEVSRRVRVRIRRFDRLFRFGGDEFCIILPETEWHGALEVAERVRESIASRPLLTSKVPGGVRMTASLGIASYPLHAQSTEGLILRADRAMQRVKGGTKNSIGIAEIAGPEAAGGSREDS